MQLLLAGDPHGDLTYLRIVYDQALAIGSDRVVLLGDVGLGWEQSVLQGEGSPFQATPWSIRRPRPPGPLTRACPVVDGLQRLATQSGIPALVLDGNHENFDWLEGQIADKGLDPDGTVALADLVRYVPRGTVLPLDGTRVLFLGGAVSMDASRRVPHRSWWRQEALTSDDVATARANLAATGGADLVLTHDVPFESSPATATLDHFPAAAVRATRANSWRVSEVLAASGAHRLVHGHLHYRYDEWVDAPQGRVLVQGLDCNGLGPQLSTLCIDTDALAAGLPADPERLEERADSSAPRRP